MVPVAIIASIAPTVIKAIFGVVSETGVLKTKDEAKVNKVLSIGSAALGGVSWAVDAFQRIKDRLKGDDPFTEEEYQHLIDTIDQNSATIDELTKPGTPA